MLLILVTDSCYRMMLYRFEWLSSVPAESAACDANAGLDSIDTPVCGSLAQNTEISTTVTAGTGPLSVGCSSRAGYTRSFLNMRYLLVLDAGHLVPMDQPERALDLLSRWCAYP
jgi:hypothetical protein